VVQADRVSIDLAGFSVLGVAGSQSGLVVPASQRSLAICNGTVANRGAAGIDAGNAAGSQFDHVRLSRNGTHGLVACFAAIVRDCIATENTGDGIQLTSAGFAIGNNCQTNGSGAANAGLNVLGTANRIEPTMPG
jgi:hypothetical protein